MGYDKFTCSYFNELPSRKRLQFDFDYLQDNAPDYLYHYSNGLYRVVIVRNFDSKGKSSSYSVMALGYPPAVGVWRSLYNTSVLKKAVIAFNHAVASHINDEHLLAEDDLPPKGDWYVSEL